MRRRVVPFVTVLAAVAAFGSGCGLTDGGAQPGVAAEVDGRTLELDMVDEALKEYCTLRALHPAADAAPRSDVRAQFVLGWMQAVGVEDLSEDYGVPLPPEAIDRALVQDNWGELGEIDEDNYEAFEWLTWIQVRLTTSIEQLGARQAELETGEPAFGQEALDRGISLVQEWLADQDPEVNPVLGELDVESGLFSGDALSVPVSNEAKAAAELTANALPPGQRCGPAGAPATQEAG